MFRNISHAGVRLLLAIVCGCVSIVPIASANNLADRDIPEEVLRAEIIVEARSPLDGKPLSATEFAELVLDVEQQSSANDAVSATKYSKFKNILFLIRLRSFLKTIGIPVK